MKQLYQLCIKSGPSTEMQLTKPGVVLPYPKALQYLQLQPAQENEPYVNLHNSRQVGPFLEIVTACWQVQGTQLTCSSASITLLGLSERREQELSMR